MTTYVLCRTMKRTGRYSAMGRGLYLSIWLWRRMRILVAHMSRLIILAPRRNRPGRGPRNGSRDIVLYSALPKRWVNSLMRGLALDRGHDLSHHVQATRALHQCAPCRLRVALRWRVVDIGRTARLEATLDWLRNRAGGRLNSRLKARLKDCSDS